MDQQTGCYEAEALAVAHLAVMDGICLGHLEQGILTRAAGLLETLVRRKCAMYVPLYDGLAFGFLKIQFVYTIEYI